jgi:glycosyltransferase involved in cell wall biosynthesis
MTRIGILTPSITSGDAVSNDVLGMLDVLKRSGEHDVRVFAEGWTLDKPRVWPASQVRTFLRKRTDILIYHYSRGWDPGLDLLHDLKCQKIVKYHNVTPPEFFAAYSSDYAAMCADGRRQIELVARAGCDRYLSASAYSMRELIAAGAPAADSFVMPPFHHIDQLDTVEADKKIVNQFNDGRRNICMIGRVSPNKGHAALIEAFAAYYREYDQNSRLIIVGKEESRLARYSKLLRELAKGLDVADKVVFTGEVSQRALKAYYRVANVFMITSEHEGFCVPLIEAMALGVPIVGYASTAIPETVGAAGLVWEDHNPYLLVESIDAVVKQQPVAAGLRQAGWQRYRQHFTNAQIEQTFVTAIHPVL